MESPAKILVVDDEASIRGMLSDMLQSEGYAVFTAANGEEALETLKSESIDLVIADIYMPGMSGLQLLETMRSLKIESEIVIMTSQSSLGTTLDASNLGAYRYITKPFNDILDVLKVVDQFFSRKRLLDRLNAKKPREDSG